MSNRFMNVGLQYADDVGNPLSGGKLRFFVTGTSTPASTYYDPDPCSGPHKNQNPITLDGAGRPPTDVWLDPNISYRVALTNANGSQTFWVKDRVSDPAANVVAAFRVYSGNPNGNLSGNAGSVGGSGASIVYDITTGRIFTCTTTGDAASAVWRSSLIGNLTDPDADRILFWDDSAGAFTYLTPGAGFAISGTTLNFGAAVASFSANKNTTDQAIPGTTETTITFGTKAFDVGSHFASNAWTPPAGTCRVGGQASFTGTADTSITVGIKKNGTLVKRVGAKLLDAVSLFTGACSAQIWATDQCNGTDVYTLSVFSEAAITCIADDPITAGIIETWFEGTMV